MLKIGSNPFQEVLNWVKISSENTLLSKKKINKHSNPLCIQAPFIAPYTNQSWVPPGVEIMHIWQQSWYIMGFAQIIYCGVMQIWEHGYKMPIIVFQWKYSLL